MNPARTHDGRSPRRFRDGSYEGRLYRFKQARALPIQDAGASTDEQDLIDRLMDAYSADLYQAHQIAERRQQMLATLVPMVAQEVEERNRVYSRAEVFDVVDAPSPNEWREVVDVPAWSGMHITDRP